jgi:hypothetical protein
MYATLGGLIVTLLISEVFCASLKISLAARTGVSQQDQLLPSQDSPRQQQQQQEGKHTKQRWLTSYTRKASIHHVEQ